jgi:hypothetical protein
VSECDREGSIMRGPWPTRNCRAMGGGGSSNETFTVKGNANLHKESLLMY